MRRALTGLAALLLTAAAVGIAVIAVPLTHYRPERPVVLADSTVSAVTAGTDLPRTVSVSLWWSNAQSFRLGASSGLVTSVAATAGSEVGCGAPVVQLDGRWVLAYCGPRPLWREIAADTVGADRDEAVAFLVMTGYLRPAAAVATRSEVSAAIRALQTLSGWKATGVLTPAELLWLREPVTPSSVELVAGQTVAGGEAVMSIASTLQSGQVVGEQPGQSGRVFGLEGSAQRFELTAGTVVDLAGLQAELHRRGLTVDALPSTAAGSTRLAQSAQFVTVPASAIVSDANGVCVQVIEGDVRRAVAVVPVDSVGDSAYVTGTLTAGADILVNPNRALGC